jgi:copper(I)-binding protein
MKRTIACVATMSVALVLVAPLSSASAATHSKLEIANVTVTATSKHGDSAVVMTIVNHTGGPISLMTVTSSLSQMNMIYYDDNMCQGNSMMTWLPNIFIMSNSTQPLGYRNQGAMLGGVTRPLKVGQIIALQVKYSNFSQAQTLTVNARVVAAPKGLHFLVSTMKM